MRATAEYLQYLQKHPWAMDQEILSDLIQEERALRPMGNSCRFMLLFHGFHLHVMMAPGKCQLPYRQSAWTDTCINYDYQLGNHFPVLSEPYLSKAAPSRPGLASGSYADANLDGRVKRLPVLPLTPRLLLAPGTAREVHVAC